MSAFVPSHAAYDSPSPVNAMSVDVEEHFQVSAFEGAVARGDWSRHESRVARNVDAVLELFERAGVHATFFVLGWIAERYPAVVRGIAAAGHEIASHGYSHVRVTQQNEAEFRDDVARTRRILEDCCGQRIRGYRAASYSINGSNLWALRVLAEEGHQYSSSIYPIRHDLYGMPEAPRFAFRLDGATILELPVSTVQLAGQRLPCGGGGYFRLLPYGFSRWAIGRVNAVDRQPTLFYFHPWEIDARQPRVGSLSLRSRLRHYTGLARMRRKLERLVRDFRWDRIDRVFPSDAQ
ncbi:MAG TPA: XrtA system polysaccharide deacetylase [Gammaproteobacteria bacterium]|nr:XrtA system polysaccharide deacetylase [Gammaproteobacteria bacterium]